MWLASTSQETWGGVYSLDICSGRSCVNNWKKTSLTWKKINTDNRSDCLLLHRLLYYFTTLTVMPMQTTAPWIAAETGSPNMATAVYHLTHTHTHSWVSGVKSWIHGEKRTAYISCFWIKDECVLVCVCYSGSLSLHILLSTQILLMHLLSWT